MKVLAIDTATERCSVALRLDGKVIDRSVETPRGHADLILPMIEAVLQEAGVTLRALDGIAYGRGPGAFTGVRIAIGVVQGLAFGAQLPTVGISDLAAVAQQVASEASRILVCMDARMGEVYCANFEVDSRTGLVGQPMFERVAKPENVQSNGAEAYAGTGFKAYQQLTRLAAGAKLYDSALPHAAAIALLGEAALGAGEGRPASAAQPVYLRDQVAFVKNG